MIVAQEKIKKQQNQSLKKRISKRTQNKLERRSSLKNNVQFRQILKLEKNWEDNIIWNDYFTKQFISNHEKKIVKVKINIESL